ncbi:MAG TPA: DUF2142 domain-containing protein, partial [Acetobacteraceae bacterium]|nr:DUF2142 domain-containing protein [Acetobacteraceae bacterium]
TAIYPPFFYAPSIVATWIGRAARFSVIHTLYLARLLTGLVCCALIAAALRTALQAGMAGAALLVFALATLPMSLALQSACSQDGLMLATAAFAACQFARLRGVPGSRGFLAMCVGLALVAMARAPYLPLALVPLAAPVPWPRRLAGAALVAGACLAWVAAAAIFTAIDFTPDRGANVGAQLRLLLDPARDVALVARTIHELGANYVQQFVAGLGWVDVPFPRLFIVAACGVLGIALLPSLTWPGRASVVVGLSVLLAAGAIVVLQYLTWTALGAHIIDGIQGRYFLPLAMVLAGLAMWRGHGRLGQACAAIVMAFPAAAIGVTVRALVVRYYLGP